MSWDPAQYLKYASERLRPALDLLARLPIEAPQTVVDLGCGTGNVAKILAARWPRARIVGIDNSAEMLAVAKASTAGGTQHEWIHADLADWAPKEPVAVVFSNAALHWHDDHATLFPRIFGWVAPGGMLAVQMPDQYAAPSHVALAAVVSSERWRDQLGPCAAAISCRCQPQAISGCSPPRLPRWTRGRRSISMCCRRQRTAFIRSSPGRRARR